jgi:signal transduction histidine kinase
MTNEVQVGLTIRGDKEQLKIIFQNIIGNAVKFTNPGGTIRLFHTLEDETLTLHIKDNGVGIPAPKLAALFEQSGPSLSTYGTAREKGTGIGLFLVRQFVEHNDGKIRITSAENLGTETCVSFACAGLRES